MRARGKDRSVWPVATMHGMMNTMMIGMMLLVIAYFGFYLPSFTGHMATYAVPLVAILGVVYLFRLPRPQLAIESDQLVYRKGRKVRRFNLANLRIGYARWHVQVGGVVGSVLIVQDGDESMSIGAYKFMLDDAAQYKLKDMEYCDIYMQTESPFRDFLGQFNEQLLRLHPQQAQSHSQSQAKAVAQAPAPLTFELQPNKVGVNSGVVIAILAGVVATSIIPSVFFFAGPLYGAITAGAAVVVAFLLLLRRKKSKRPERLYVSVEDQAVHLSTASERLSSVPVAELRWSAGTNRISSEHSSWLMPIMILQFPNYDPVTIGTLSPERWTFDVTDVGRPQFQLGVALWLQLARALGIDGHLK